MFYLLVDTCVWLDLAKDSRQHPVVGVVEEMVRDKLITLLVPPVLLDEFRRNRDRVERDSAKGLTTHFKAVREAVNRAGGNKRKMKAVLAHLDDVDHKIPLLGAAAAGVLDRIEALLQAGNTLPATDAIKVQCAQRAVDKQAPFHQGRNSMADAILFETYAASVRQGKPRERFAFVTHNKNDFSSPNHHKVPHPDLAGEFSRIKSLFFITLPEALRRVDPSFVSEAMLDLSYMDEPRALSEIVSAEGLLFHQVWYNRHMNLRYEVQTGAVKVVEKETEADWRRHPRTTISRDIWEGALRAAKNTEQKVGKKNLGPWDDFEWGMVNGKLSAIRWVLGYEWDMLDT